MSEWREHNFLERLAHGSLQAKGRVCPDIEVFCEATASREAAPISGELLDHLDHCPACSDLRSRLASFDQPNGQEMDLGAVEAEQRLDSWLKGFLAAQTLRPQPRAIVTPPKVTALPFAQKAKPIWRLQWALAAAATIIFAAGVLYLRRAAHGPTPLIARATPEQQPGTPPISPALPEANAGSAKDTTQKTSRVHQSLSASSPGQKVAPSAKPEPPRPVEQAPQVVAQTTPNAENPPSQNGKNTAANTATLPTAPVALPPRSSSSGRVMNAAPRTVGTMGAPRPSAPLHVQLPEGTRIWLSLDSVTPEKDGSFQFHATLLLPVTNSGVVVFEKGAEVLGSGRTNQKQTVIQITNIVTREQHFKVNSATTGTLKGPGSGNTVSFEQGKVFEMWLDSASTFEATDGPSGNPQR